MHMHPHPVNRWQVAAAFSPSVLLLLLLQACIAQQEHLDPSSITHPVSDSYPILI
jgi:hypothetical protein